VGTRKSVHSRFTEAAYHSLNKLKEFAVKYIASGLLVLGLLAVQVSEANAAACAAGPHRAGCVGPRGAVGVHRGYGYRPGGYGYGYGHGGYGYHPYGYGGAAAVGAAALGAAAVGAAVAAPHCWINSYGTRVCN
jgi:hypothetical protein